MYCIMLSEKSANCLLSSKNMKVQKKFNQRGETYQFYQFGDCLDIPN